MLFPFPFIILVLNEKMLWVADPLLGKGRDISNIQQSLLSNGFANKHVCTATIRNSNT
jgi:hypothetical protein